MIPLLNKSSLNSREIILHVKVNKKHGLNFIFVFSENRNSTYTYIDIRSRNNKNNYLKIILSISNRNMYIICQ